MRSGTGTGVEALRPCRADAAPSAPRPLAQCGARREVAAGRARTAAVRGAAPGAATTRGHWVLTLVQLGPGAAPEGAGPLPPSHLQWFSRPPPRPSAVARPGPAPPGGGDAPGRRFRRTGGARGAALAARLPARPVSAGPGRAVLGVSAGPCWGWGEPGRRDAGPLIHARC